MPEDLATEADQPASMGVGWTSPSASHEIEASTPITRHAWEASLAVRRSLLRASGGGGTAEPTLHDAFTDTARLFVR